MNMDSVMMQNSAEEEATYGNITHQPTPEQTQVNLNEDDEHKHEIIKAKKAKQGNTKQLKHSEEAEAVYAQVNPCKRKDK